MASPPPRIHGFTDFAESYRLVDNNKYSEFDAYLIATCRVDNRVLAAGEPLDALAREIRGYAAFFPGRQYPHPGAKPRGVVFCDASLAPTPGPPWSSFQSSEPVLLPWSEAPSWKVAADDGVFGYDSTALGLGFPDPYVLTRAPAELPIASSCDVEVLAERARPGGGGLPAADRLALSLTFWMPRQQGERTGHRIQQDYAGPIEGDLYALVTRLEKALPDRPASYAPGPAAAVVRAVRFADVEIKPDEFDPSRVQRWRLAAVVEAELPLTWREG